MSIKQAKINFEEIVIISRIGNSQDELGRIVLDPHRLMRSDCEENMALYKNPAYITQNYHVVFDSSHAPDTPAPYSGIYRCIKCQHEIGSPQGLPLPSEPHPQHPPQFGPIKWQLIVFAQHNE